MMKIFAVKYYHWIIICDGSVIAGSLSKMAIELVSDNSPFNKKEVDRSARDSKGKPCIINIDRNG